METCTWKTKEEMKLREIVWIRDGLELALVRAGGGRLYLRC
jgi:hypothetical protein